MFRCLKRGGSGPATDFPDAFLPGPAAAPSLALFAKGAVFPLLPGSRGHFETCISLFVLQLRSKESMDQMKSRRDCTCPCHSGGQVIHIVPCCDGVPFRLPKRGKRARKIRKQTKKSS
jgi:hypothetical protein